MSPNLNTDLLMAEHHFLKCKIEEDYSKLIKDKLNPIFNSVSAKVFECLTEEALTTNESEVREYSRLYLKVWKEFILSLFKEFEFVSTTLEKVKNANDIMDIWEYAYETYVIYIFLTQMLNTDKQQQFLWILDEMIPKDKKVLEIYKKMEAKYRK
jgi:hypothetical protein